MNKRTLKSLFIVLFALTMILIAMEMGDRSNFGAEGNLLFPQLKSSINEVNSLTVDRPGDEPSIAIRRETAAWVVASRDNYPADLGRIRQILIALGDAKIVEEKTSNPDRYNELGVRNVQEQGSKAVRITVAGPGFSDALLLGLKTQGDFRYVRIVDESTSWLIDQNPDAPDSAGPWLKPGIIDIDAGRVKSVTVRHADGETLSIVKQSEEDETYGVEAIPDGRQLRYASVANGIAEVLKNLQLDDVRKSIIPDTSTVASVVTEFATFAGNRIVVKSFVNEQETWIRLDVIQIAEGSEDMAAIDRRVQGWDYRIAKLKADQLSRRWEDILQAAPE